MLIIILIIAEKLRSSSGINMNNATGLSFLTPNSSIFTVVDDVRFLTPSTANNFIAEFRVPTIPALVLSDFAVAQKLLHN